MSRRIDIELTSTRPDGTWTWRAAGAREPKGVLDGTLLPSGTAVGAVLRADAESEFGDVTILSVVAPKGKDAKTGVLELLPSDKPFEPVTQQLAKRDRNDRGPRRDDRGPRRDDRGPRSDRPGGDRPRRDDRAPRGDRPAGERPSGDRPSGDRGPRRDDRGPRGERPSGDRRQRPNFTPPPELPQRPKAKRLKPGRAHRQAVLAELTEPQRMVAERALQGGLRAVREAVNEQNQRLRAEGKEEVPAAGLVALAEGLLPRLRVADWLDRADAAVADLDELDLRDLRSVVAAGDDPIVARDESTRELAERLRVALVDKQEKELLLWFGDIDAAIGVGRVVRALKLSSQPPKAGVPFPAELAAKLVDATAANLTPDAMPDRWSAVLEALAFSPIRSQVVVSAPPAQVSDELRATVARVASLLPKIAALFGVEPREGGPSPKPLRPTRPAKKAPAGARPVPPPPATAPVAEPAAVGEDAVATAPEPEAAVAEEVVAEVEVAAEVEVSPEVDVAPEAEVAADEPVADEPVAEPSEG